MAMTERVIAKPLTGSEVIEAIIHGIKIGFAKQAAHVPHEVVSEFTNRLRAQMKRDCYLNPVISYSVYSAESTVNVNYQKDEPGFFEVRSSTKIVFPNTGTNIKETMVNLVTKAGEPSTEKEMHNAEVVVSESPKAPNEVRVSTQQPVPVRAKTPQGKIVERTVKYAQKAVTGA